MFYHVFFPYFFFSLTRYVFSAFAGYRFAFHFILCLFVCPKEEYFASLHLDHNIEPADRCHARMCWTERSCFIRITISGNWIECDREHEYLGATIFLSKFQ